MDREDYGEQITRRPTITEVEVARRKGSAQNVVDHLTQVSLLYLSINMNACMYLESNKLCVCVLNI